MRPICERAKGTKMKLDGHVGAYLRGVVDQWLMIAPKANPGMLEMFRDRDAPPLRQMVPWAGEFAGKYLTSAVQVMRVTRDKALKSWLNEFVAMLTELQDDDGYLGPWPRGHRLTNTDALGGGTWDTWGHYHAILGLVLWYDECRDPEALDCARRIADLLCEKYLGKKKVQLVETGSTEMNLAPIHGLCLLYKKTKEERYLNLSIQIVEEFGTRRKGQPLAGDYLNQALQGTEFFETPKPRWESLHPIMGLAELYWITGNDTYREAFEQIWWSIVKLDRHNNGGFSSGEKATGNPYHLAAIESCCTIAWAALSVEMLKLTRNSVVADELELSLLNSVMGMHSSTGRWATYDTPMNGVRCASAHSIVFQSREGTPELNCCSVNTPRGFGMLSDWALMRDEDGLILNYYGPSKMTARLRGNVNVTVTQETEYPVEGKITISVKPTKAVEFTLKLRIPYWSSTTRVRLNGKAVHGVKSGQYLSLMRVWQAGDSIEVEMDLALHVWEGARDCEGLASIYRGPILMTYDHRYNLNNSDGGQQVRDTATWDRATCMLDIPYLDASRLKPKRVAWTDWLPPMLLLEVKGESGRPVRLCDFGSAGEAGTPYCSWLPVTNCPVPAPFSKENPLRSSQV